MEMKRRFFLQAAGIGALSLAFGRRVWAAGRHTALRAFPKPPWKKVDGKKLREPHDLAG